MTEFVKTKTIYFLRGVPSRRFAGGVCLAMRKLPRNHGMDARLETQRSKGLEPKQEQNTSCTLRRLLHLESER